MINKERLINSFIKMAETPSVSGKEEAMSELLKKEFQQRGWEFFEDNTGEILGTGTGNILVRIPGNVERTALLFAAHIDTVSPGDAVKVIRDEKDFLRSNGNSILGSDDKAGIASILEAIDVIKENNLPHPPLELLFTVGEESGLLGSKNFDYSLVKAKQAFVLDHCGAPGGIVIKAPCQYEMVFKVKGRSAHAGVNPEDGISAIHVMAKALAAMPCGRIDVETTCNFGIIKGGLAHNIVAEECSVLAEARSLDRNKLEALIVQMEAIFIKKVTAEKAEPIINKECVYTETNLATHDAAVKIAFRAGEKNGLPVRLESTGGGSDASIINAHGISCVNLAVGMSNVHTCEEYIKTQDLVNGARWVLGIIQEAAL